MVLKHHNPTRLSQGLGNALPLIRAQNNAAECSADGLRAPEVTGILVNNVERQSKCGLGFSSRGVRVAGSMDIRSYLVDGAVDYETSRIDGSLVATDNLALLINLHHVACLEHTGVLSHANECLCKFSTTY